MRQNPTSIRDTAKCKKRCDKLDEETSEVNETAFILFMVEIVN